MCKNIFKKSISLMLSIVVLSITFLAMPKVDAITSLDVETELDKLMTQYGFKVGAKYDDNDNLTGLGADKSMFYKGSECYGFIDLISHELYGHGIPPYNTSNRYEFINYSTEYKFTQVGSTLTVNSGDLSLDSLKELFSKAQSGDIVQMDYTKRDWKTGETEGTSHHTMIIYSVSDTGAVFYHSGSSYTIWFGAASNKNPLYGTTGNELEWEDFYDYFCSSGDGISIYRSNEVDASVEPTVMTSLVIETMPDKVYYPVGGIFDRNGLTARVTYSDGYTKLLYPEHLKFSNTDFVEPGIQFIRADYYGIYTSFPVVVYSEFPEKESQTAIPADRNLYVDFEWSVTDMNGMLITKDSLNGSTGVIIFFKATGDCYNSNQTIKSIAASEWVKNDKVQVVAVDVTGSDNETVTEYKNTYAADCDDIIFAKDTTGALSKFKNELGLNNTVAANIITDESGAVRYAWTGNYNADYYQNALANIVDGINSTGDMSYYDICVKGEYDYDMANAVFENINKYRIDLGLSTLKMNKELSESAMKRAAELSIIYSHTRPDYSNCFSILPVEFQSSTMRENIAAGYVTADDVASAWINSYGHNKNIIASDNISTGIGCFCHNGKYYWVQMFSAEDTIAQSVELSGVECVSVDMKTTGSMLNLNAQLSSENLTVGNSSAIVLNHTNTEFYSALTLLEPTFVESSSPDVASVAISSTGTFVTAKTEGSAILRIGFVSEQGTETVVEVLVNVTEPSTDNQDKPTELTEPSTGGEDISTTPTNPVALGLLGDANEDGKVNIKDATLIQKSIANLTTLTETGEALADADLNTKINIKDATAIQKHIAGIETGYPIGKPKTK